MLPVYDFGEGPLFSLVRVDSEVIWDPLAGFYFCQIEEGSHSLVGSLPVESANGSEDEWKKAQTEADLKTGRGHSDAG